METLENLYAEVDNTTLPLIEIHANRLQCKAGCFDCCADDITVFRIEAAHIESHYPDLLQNGIPHPKGRCAFLDETGRCRIYEHRPYVCRTQGLPLRWLTEESLEYRDICPLNETNVPIEDIPVAQCWTLGPAEGRLAELQRTADEGLPRQSLRSLFRKS